MAVDRGAKTSKIRSLIPYQILLFLNNFYTGLFLICEILIFIYKGTVLPFPPNSILAIEVIITLLICGVDFLRIFFGKKGNLTERAQPLAVSLGLSIPIVLGDVFLIVWQTYVLRAELILVSIHIVMLALSFILGLAALISINASIFAAVD